MQFGFGFGPTILGRPQSERLQNVISNTRDFSAGWTAQNAVQGTGIASPLGGTAQYWRGNSVNGVHRLDKTGVQFAAYNVLSIHGRTDGNAYAYLKLNLRDLTASVDHRGGWRYLTGAWEFYQNESLDGNGRPDASGGFFRFYIYVDGTARGLVGHNIRIEINVTGDGIHNEGNYIDGVQLEQIAGRVTPGRFVEGPVA